MKTVSSKFFPVISVLAVVAALPNPVAAQADTNQDTVPMRPSATAQPTAAEAATQRARATSHAVRVDGLTTPTRTVDANPDGSYTLRQYSQPARKLVDDAWTDLDATLARQPDGSIAPRVTTSALTLSGGGDTTLATMSIDGHHLSLTLPTPLPEPDLAGDTATYRDVLPGVDLQARATPRARSPPSTSSTTRPPRPTRSCGP